MEKPKKPGLPQFLEPKSHNTNVASQGNTDLLGALQIQHATAQLSNFQIKSENR